MCNQTVGLVAGAVEAAGIPTVTIQLLKHIAEKVRPPRSLWVPFAHGYPLEAPLEAEKQKRVMRAALELAHAPGEAPLLVDYKP
jgi:D-proline reductase (dithiol) PrdB